MIRRYPIAAICAIVLSAGCSRGDTAASGGNADDAVSWWIWHAEKQGVDRIVYDAINEPDGGDYATAADAIRGSSRPPAVKQFEIGQLVVGGIMERSKRRPPESLEQGLRMMEDSTVADGQHDESALQELRWLFERGVGRPPNAFPIDPVVAACWLAEEERRSNDPARCIALRRERLPSIESPHNP